MKLKELLATLDNGATHLTIYDDETGEVLIIKYFLLLFKMSSIIKC